MKNGLTIGFEFLEDFYYSIVDVKETEKGTHYEIRLMDNRLTRLSGQDQTIHEEDGYLHLLVTENDQMATFKRKVAESLSQFLRKPIRTANDSQS